MDEAVDVAYNAIMANHGQNCCAGSRTFVQEDIYDKFVAKAAEKAKNRKVGDPWKDGIEHGPQVRIVSNVRAVNLYITLLVLYCTKACPK